MGDVVKVWFYQKRLQWGHAFSDVEISHNQMLRRCNMGQLQWGHAFSDVEIRDERPILQHEGRGASMGPRLFRRGNGVGYRRHLVEGFASMGPRLFRRGNSPDRPPL